MAQPKRALEMRSGARYIRWLFYLAYVAAGLGALLVIAHRSLVSTAVGVLFLACGLIVGRRARLP